MCKCTEHCHSVVAVNYDGKTCSVMVVCDECGSRLGGVDFLPLEVQTDAK